VTRGSLIGHVGPRDASDLRGSARPLEPPHPTLTRYAVVRRELDHLDATRAQTVEIRLLREALRALARVQRGAE